MPDPVATPPPPPISGIKPPPPLSFEGNLSENWKYFKQKWGHYVILTNLDKQSREYRVALLLHTMGDEALKVYNGFHFTTDPGVRTVQEIIEQFDNFAVGEVNETYERFVFNKRDQREGETFESFLAAIRSLVRTCNYCENCVNSIVRDRIVIGISDNATQQTLLKEIKLDLEKSITICKASENATTQGKLLRADVVHKVSSTNPYKHFKDRNKKFESSSAKKCKFCGSVHEMKKEKCKAYGATCHTCHLKNHFSRMCPKNQSSRKPKKNVHMVADSQCDDESNSDDLEWINMVKYSPGKEVKCLLSIGTQDIVFQVDTGATVNILPERFINSDNLEKTDKTLKMWNGAELVPLGTTRVKLHNPKNGKKYSVEFIVVKDNYIPLIGLRAAEQMKLITVNSVNVERVAAISVIDKYSDIFDGKLGTLEGEVHFKVDKDVQPVIMPTKRIPLAIRPKLKDALDKYTDMKVLAPVDEATPWVSQLAVTQKKSGELRLCLDPRELNKSLMREHYTLPVLEETLHELGESRVFSKADLSSGYWHIQLDEESSLMTTFQTCYGRYRWLRLPFGTCVSSEIFQKKLHEALQGLQGIACIADDVIIHGKTITDHDKNLDAFLSRCRSKGIQLNKNKLELRLSEITFMGHRVTQDGLQPDPEKVRSITCMPPPQNLEELRRFLGMANYLGKFIPNLTAVTEPLRNLTKDRVPYVWSETQNTAFNTVKHLITTAPVLAFYDPKKELILENDACEYGIGSAILQEGRPIAYASRSLSPSETNYAQIEKEMLALTYGLEKFHHYTFGRKVKAITDHKPLVAIVLKPLSKAPKRLQALLLRTQKYDFDLSYKPGKTIPLADTLSRAPLPDKPTTELVSVNNISFLPIKVDKMNEIRVATEQDDNMQLLKNAIMKGWPSDKSTLPPSLVLYYNYRDELTVQDGIILRGDRVVIPTSLRQDIKQKVHTGHLGINSCLRRARELVYWPGMSNEIRQYVETCDVCATYSDKQSPETLHMHDIPHRPWEKVSSDLFELNGRSYLVTVDYYSNFYEVDYLPQTKSTDVITKLKHHFARHGIPDTFISDGGPQFDSDKFKHFCTSWDFKHEMTSPYNSKANGVAEAAVKSAKKIMRKCAAAHEDPYIGLLNARNTPTEGLDTSPSQRLFGRRTKTQVPTTLSLLKPDNINELQRDKMIHKKQTAALRQNEHRKDLKPLKPGDNVRIQPTRLGEKEWKPATVTKQLKNRTYEVTTTDGQIYTRNRQFLRTAKLRETPVPLESNNVPVSTETDTQVQLNSKNNEPGQTHADKSDANVMTQQDQNNDTMTEVTVPSPVNKTNPVGYRTRSGRLCNKPKTMNL